jgi:hypothetical protein
MEVNIMAVKTSLEQNIDIMFKNMKYHNDKLTTNNGAMKWELQVADAEHKKELGDTPISVYFRGNHSFLFFNTITN